MKKCLVCRISFVGNPSRKVKYCSVSCRYLANSRRRWGNRISGPKKYAPRGRGSIRYGYRQITKKGHPNAGKKGHLFEHTLVMSNFLGRPLAKGESVHHKNGDRLDNRLENLELWSSHQPKGQRVQDKIQWAIEFLSQNGYKVEKLEIKEFI